MVSQLWTRLATLLASFLKMSYLFWPSKSAGTTCADWASPAGPEPRRKDKLLTKMTKRWPWSTNYISVMRPTKHLTSNLTSGRDSHPLPQNRSFLSWTSTRRSRVLTPTARTCWMMSATTTWTRCLMWGPTCGSTHSPSHATTPLRSAFTSFCSIICAISASLTQLTEPV